MLNEELKDKLNELKVEDYIWVLYIVIIIASWYSNHLERKYFLNNDYSSKEKYKKIMVLIFLTLFIVYFYFAKSSYDDIIKLKASDTNKKKELTYLAFYASFLILISGVIFLYIALMDENLDVELAFN